MPSSSHQTLLQVRLNAPGLPGIYLEERLGPYRYLDGMRGSKPRAVTLIGGWLKRQFLAASMGIWADDHGTIAASISGSSIVFDCELHLPSEKEIPRVRAGPVVDNVRRHLVKRPLSRPPDIAYDIYSSILSYFSDVVLIFIPDFGGLEPVIRFLVYWMSCVKSKDLPSRILLVHEQPPKEGEVRSQLIGAYSNFIRTEDPTSAHSPRAIGRMIDVCFQIRDVAMHDDIHRQLRLSMRESFFARVACGFDFKARHFKALFQTAVKTYADDPSRAFEFIAASRMRYPIPVGIDRSVSSYLGTCPGREEVQAVASALVLDAYPEQMHRFPPEKYFRAVYQAPMRLCEATLALPGLLQEIRDGFVSLASTVLRGTIPLELHRWILKQTRFSMPSGSSETCSFCLLEKPRYSLRCLHHFCQSCMIREGKVDPKQHHVTTECPLCKELISVFIMAQPPTAGLRLLDIHVSNYQTVLGFLDALLRSLSVSSISLPDLFDVASGSGTGMFFVIAVFVEGWQLEDCKYHVKNVSRPKIKRHAISFGKKLSWNLNHELARHDVVLDMQKQMLHSSPLPLLRSDVHVETADQFHPKELLPLSSRLIASLFYVEVVSVPTFYSAPDTCKALIQCRIPPGPVLYDLLAKLHRDKVRLYYRANETIYIDSLLCDESTLKRVEHNEEFRRQIILEVVSYDTVIHILIDGSDGKRHSISCFPSTLDDLMANQGLDCYFGWRSYTQYLSASRAVDEASSEVDSLVKLLNTY